MVTPDKGSFYSPRNGVRREVDDLKSLASFNALRDVGDVWKKESDKLRVENSNNWARGRRGGGRFAWRGPKRPKR